MTADYTKGQVVVHPKTLAAERTRLQAGPVHPSAECLPARSADLQAAQLLHSPPRMHELQAQSLGKSRSSTCLAVSHCAVSSNSEGQRHLPGLQAPCDMGSLHHARLAPALL